LQKCIDESFAGVVNRQSLNPYVMLTENEKKFLGILETVDTQTLWGIAISEAIKNPEPVVVRRLIASLRSQARDCNEVMLSIIGEPGIQALNTL
jgi:hypothetical protein